jgi:hypothetical protein
MRPAALVVLLPFASAARAQVAFPEDVDFSNTVFVGEEPDVVRAAFFRADEHRAAGRALEAGREVTKLLRSTASGRTRLGERLVVPVETAALAFLLSLPDDVRAELAKEEAAVEPAAPRDGDPAALRRFAARRPWSPHAASAQLEAATRELLAGDADSAASDFETLVHWPTLAPSATRAVAAARLLEAQARLGETPLDSRLAHWPLQDATPLVRAGTATSFGELLAAARAAPVAATRGLPTLLGDDARSSRATTSDRPPSARHVVRFFGSERPSLFADPELALHRERFLPMQERSSERDEELADLPTRAPLVLGDRLVTIDPISDEGESPVAIHVRSLTTGTDLFPPIRSDVALLRDPQEGGSVALDRTALSASGGHLFVTLAHSGVRITHVGTELVTTKGESSSLFCLDLQQQGKVEWKATLPVDEETSELGGAVMHGPAALVAGRVVVAASRLKGRDTECSLVAFDAQSGQLAGHCFLATAPAIPRYSDRFTEEETRRVEPSPVAVRDGTVYVCTNLGVVAAVRAADLELEWAFRYHRRPAPESERYERPALFDLDPWPGRAPVALADRVLAAPSDSLYLYSLARWPNAKGDLLLNEPVEKQTRVAWLGADATHCWFLRRESGQLLVEATDHDGSVLWRNEPLGRERIVGVPALTGRFLFVPTDACIYRVDLAKEGLADCTIPPPTALEGERVGVFGDLAVSDRWLLSTSQRYTITFTAGE